MKVVLFCGGRGIRLREYSSILPKPMVRIGYRPVLWHVMRYFAYYGHTEFIVCLGYGGAAIKEYFLRYEEAVSNDFVMSDGGGQITMLGTDIADWRITFVDTGPSGSIGERLLAVRPFLAGEELFLANYADTLTDAPIDRLIGAFCATDATAQLLSVRPTGYGFYAVAVDDTARVTAHQDPTKADVWINGGYFVFRQGIFDELRPGEDLVDDAFARLAAAGRLTTVQYPGFWAPVDTLRDVQRMQSLVESDAAPWMVWAGPPPPNPVVELDDAHGVTDEPALARDDAPARARDEAPADVTALDIAPMGS